MKTIPMKSGGHAFILDAGDTCPPNEICFLEDEYRWAQKISAGLAQDPESRKSFWETVLTKKRELPGYLLFMDFPKEVQTNSVESKGKDFLNSPSGKISQQILETLKGRIPEDVSS